MKSARVTFSNGEIIETSINGTDLEIKSYYAIGKEFNLGNSPVKGDGNIGDNMQKITKCEVLQNFFFTFIGRNIGQAGKTYEIEKEIKAYTEPEAIFELYETFEHIQGLTIDRNKHEQGKLGAQEPTFGAHVNNFSERVKHRSNRRLALIDKLQAEQSSRVALDFTIHCKNNRRDLTKPRKIK